MNMLSKLSLRVLGCCLALAVAACTKSYTAQKTAAGLNPWTIPGTLRIGIPDEPDNLNPMFAHTAETDEVDQLPP